MRRHSPLIIGYGGWEGDVVMTALKRRLQNTLPYNIYWFCHQREDLDLLPDWLKGNEQVYFVIPPAEKKGKVMRAESSDIARDSEKINSDLQKSPAAEQENTQRLKAQVVLDKLIQIFELDEPALTKDPLGFFAEHLRVSLLSDGSGIKEEPDKYLIKEVIKRIEYAREQSEKVSKNMEKQFEDIFNAIRRSDYRKAIAQATEISFSALDDGQLEQIMEAIYSAAINLFDDSQDEIDGYSLVIKLGDKLLTGNRQKPVIRERIAKALLYKGITLGTLQWSEKAIAVYDEILKRFSDAQEPAIREQVAKALVNKGVRLSTLQRSEEEIAVYDEILKRFGDAQEPAIRKLCAKAMESRKAVVTSSIKD
jgi:tetratricopeptide (TPR) repeat protein